MHWESAWPSDLDLIKGLIKAVIIATVQCGWPFLYLSSLLGHASFALLRPQFTPVYSGKLGAIL